MFVLLQAEKNCGWCVYWDWYAEREFAEFIGDKEAEDLFTELLASNAPNPIRAAVYKNCKETRRITRKRSKIIKELSYWFKPQWSGTGWGGHAYTGRRRYKTFYIKGGFRDFLKLKNQERLNK